MKILNTLAILGLAWTLQACDSNPQPDGGEAATAPAAAETTAQSAENTADQAPGRVFIVSPDDGATVNSPVTVVFGIEGFSVAPAGTYEERSGHHHLIIDSELPPLDQPIPTDEQHLHFGQGQTETVVELEPGEHTLQLVLGDGNHIPHDPALISERIRITVTGAD